MNTFNFILTNLNTSEVKTLTAAPAGWADSTERHFRSVKYNSVLRSDALSQRFPNIDGELFDHAGYWFILNAYLADGTKALIKYERQILNIYTQQYEDDYIGMLDFSVDSGWNNEPGKWFEIKTIDSRKLAKFISRDEIEYNIFDLVSSDNITVPDFTNPYQEATYKKVDVWLNSESNGHMANITTNLSADELFNVPYFKVNDDYNVNEIGARLDLKESPSIYPSEADVSIYSNDLTQSSFIENIIISGDINIFYSGGGTITGSPVFSLTFKIGMVSKDSEGLFFESNLTEIDSITSPSTGTGLVKNINLSDLDLPTIEVPAGGELSFQILGELTVTGGTIFGFTLGLYTTETEVLNVTVPATDITKFNFYEKTLGWEDNQIRGMMVNEATERLIQLMTSETDTSKLLDAPIIGRTDSEFNSYSTNGLMSLEHVTNGFQLRQLTDRAINLSFTDLFLSLSAIRPLGIWYNKENDIFIIDEIKAFYKDEQFPIHLGYVNDLKVSPSKELYFNSIVSGFPKTVYEDFSGANEINTETEHQTSIETKTQKNVRSIALQETIGVELTRRKNISLYESEDTKLDDSIFITTVDSSKTTVQGGLSDASGIINIDEYYNLLKTPRQNLQRWGEILEARGYFDASEVTQFTKSAKDVNISYTDPDTGLTVNEFDSLPQTHVSTKLLLPEEYEFEAIYSKEIRDELKADPHRYYALYDKNGNELYGYVSSIEGNSFKGKGTYILTRANINRT